MSAGRACPQNPRAATGALSNPTLQDRSIARNGRAPPNPTTMVQPPTSEPSVCRTSQLSIPDAGLHPERQTCRDSRSRRRPDTKGGFGPPVKGSNSDTSPVRRSTANCRVVPGREDPVAVRRCPVTSMTSRSSYSALVVSNASPCGPYAVISVKPAMSTKQELPQARAGRGRRAGRPSVQSSGSFADTV